MAMLPTGAQTHWGRSSFASGTNIDPSYGFLGLLKLLCRRPGQDAQGPRNCLQRHIDPGNGSAGLLGLWKAVAALEMKQLVEWMSLSSRCPPRPDSLPVPRETGALQGKP